MSSLAYIALGSNLGDRRENLNRALQALGEHPGLQITRISPFHETAPVGGPSSQFMFLNAAAELRTELGPEGLLQWLLDVEERLGRIRAERNAPRTIDLDLLFYENLVRPGPDPVVPHPRLHERAFVLGPLAHIAPEFRHPAMGKTVQALLEALRTPCRELLGKRAVVTGSTSGIGRAIAVELATAGADVVVHGRRSRELADEVAAQVQTWGVRALARLADVRSPEECQQLVDWVWAEAGGADIWVNNAGADTLTGAAARWPFEQKLAALFAIDVTATMLLARAVGQCMKERGRGVILTVGWDQAETGMEGDSGQLFAASKGAVMAFTRSLALSLAPQVRVNCLAPGWIRTAWGVQASAAWQERALRETPLARWGTPEDVAHMARWLAAPAAAFITGQIVRVNGGAVR